MDNLKKGEDLSSSPFTLFRCMRQKSTQCGNTLVALGGLFLGGGMYMGAGSTTISVIPPWLVLGALVFATVVGFVAGIVPANKAVKISALEAIRHD